MIDAVCSIFMTILIITLFLIIIPFLILIWTDAISEIKNLFDNR